MLDRVASLLHVERVAGLFRGRNLSPVAVVAGVTVGSTVNVHDTWGLTGSLVTLAVYLAKLAVDVNRLWSQKRDSDRKLERRLRRIENKLALDEEDTPAPRED